MIDQTTNQIIDPTWLDAGRDYVGVAFSAPFVLDWQLKRKRYQILHLDDDANDPIILAGIVALPGGAPVKIPDSPGGNG